MKKLRAIDIFAGAGGLSLGFEQSGFDVPFAVELERHAAETYRQNRCASCSVHVGDVRDVLENIEICTDLQKRKFDVLIGGPPCQGFSISNTKTRNLQNPQNTLLLKYIDFVYLLKPKFFVIENVAGLESFEGGKYVESVKQDLISAGYYVKHCVLNAADFGVPQVRNRIFIIGSIWDVAEEIITQLLQVKKTKVTVFDAISDLPIVPNGNSIDELPKRVDVERSLYQQALLHDSAVMFNNLTTKHTDEAISRFKMIKQGENLLKLVEKHPHLVQNYKNTANIHRWVYLRLPWAKPSIALNNFRKNMLIHPEQDRGLTVREAARLQSFPDSYIFHGPKWYQQQQVANAVPPMMSYEIAELIKGYL